MYRKRPHKEWGPIHIRLSSQKKNSTSFSSLSFRFPSPSSISDLSLYHNHRKDSNPLVKGKNIFPVDTRLLLKAAGPQHSHTGYVCPAKKSEPGSEFEPCTWWIGPPLSGDSLAWFWPMSFNTHCSGMVWRQQERIIPPRQNGKNYTSLSPSIVLQLYCNRFCTLKLFNIQLLFMLWSRTCIAPSWPQGMKIPVWWAATQPLHYYRH